MRWNTIFKKVFGDELKAMGFIWKDQCFWQYIPEGQIMKGIRLRNVDVQMEFTIDITVNCYADGIVTYSKRGIPLIDSSYLSTYVRWYLGAYYGENPEMTKYTDETLEKRLREFKETLMENILRDVAAVDSVRSLYQFRKKKNRRRGTELGFPGDIYYMLYPALQLNEREDALALAQRACDLDEEEYVIEHGRQKIFVYPEREKRLYESWKESEKMVEMIRNWDADEINAILSECIEHSRSVCESYFCNNQAD